MGIRVITAKTLLINTKVKASMLCAPSRWATKAVPHIKAARMRKSLA
jgi:hypothetical protein